MGAQLSALSKRLYRRSQFWLRALASVNAVPGMSLAAATGMNRHFLGISVFLLVSVTLLAAAVIFHWLWLIYAVLVAAPIMGAVMATAFMRPKGHPPEHHTSVDRYLNDTDR
ncbi:MAG TPA: hypothetical protein VFQ61_17960 [Polyangiaceae bacterium]|nr:hypothetical protein [Polyangiaceae bacterium]